MRVHAVVLAQVDLVDGGASQRGKARGQLTLPPGQGEHRAVVIWVGVNVEQPRGRHRRLKTLELV